MQYKILILRIFCLESHVTHSKLSEYKLTAIVLDICLRILFITSGIKKDEIYKRSFLELSFATKSLDPLAY
jgi:hypothetical protein